MKKQKLVYIGHEYHNKTQSTQFLIEIFKTKFDVDVFTFDMEQQKFNGDKDTNIEEYDALILFQMPISVKLLKEKFKFKIGSYFPMYDGTGEASEEFWIQYKEFNIINFSYTLHKKLLRLGFSTYYIQYFPKPMEIDNFGKKDSIFFWNRRNLINVNYLEDIIEALNTKKIHLHMAMDPNEKKVEVNKSIQEKYSLTYSTWFNTRTEMQKIIESSSIYIAPRFAEGIGMSFLEAMAMGRCVVAVNNPTMNEYIINGVTGFLYEYENPKIFIDTDILEIQKNTYNFIKEGYENWEKNKFRILDWVLKKNETILTFFKESKKTYKIWNIISITKRMDGSFYLYNKMKLSPEMILFLKKVYKKIKRKSE